MDSMNLVKIEEKDFQVETLAVTAHLLSSDLTYHEGLENVNQEKQETYFFVGEGAFSLAYELFLSMRDIYYMLVSEFLAKNPDKRVIAEVWLCKADDKHMPRLKADLVHVFDYYKKDYTSHQKLDD